MPAALGYVAALLQAALALLGFVQASPNLPQAQHDQAVQVAQRAITAAANALTSNPAPAQQSPVAAPGMSKYTDPDFGFSFWYPNGLQISTATKKPDGSNFASNYGPHAKVVKTIYAKDFFYIEEVYSPDTSLYYQESAGPFGSDINQYYFDRQAHTWMDVNDGGPAGKYSGGTKPADVSKNTMGGLHLLYGYARFSSAYVVPLSAHNFLFVSRLYGDKDNTPLFDAFVKTIAAADPSVATPVSAAEQIKTVQAEKDAYAAQQSAVTASPSSGPAPLTVHFGLPQTAGDQSIDYGDGTSCSTANPDGSQNCDVLTHTYTSPGTYIANGYRHVPTTLLGSATVVVR